MTESRLTLTPVSEDDASHLICRVKNSMIPGAVMEDSVRLDVHCKSSLLLSPLILCDQSEIELVRQFQHQRLIYVFCPPVSSSHFLSLFLSISLFYVLPFISWAFCLLYGKRNETTRLGHTIRSIKIHPKWASHWAATSTATTSRKATTSTSNVTFEPILRSTNCSGPTT